MDDDFEIPWGSLPIEQYLIENWNDAATEPPAQQRLRLIREFLDLDEFPAAWLSSADLPYSHQEPTTAQIDTILQPWRSHELHKKAWGIITSGREVPVLLRTYYSPDPTERSGHDEKIEEWAHASYLLEDCLDFAYLNDAQLFDFGPDWHRVYEIMPEVAGPMDGGNIRKQEPSPRTLPRFKECLREWKYTDEWKQTPHQYIENMATSLQRGVTAGYLLVADQEAFQSDYLRLIYIDYKFNIIRESRVEADETSITDVIMDWDQAGMLPAFWERGIGDKYRVDGELGAALYQLNEDDWADPEQGENQPAESNAP